MTGRSRHDRRRFDGGLTLGRWYVYCDVPVGFGRVLTLDLGWHHGDWIGSKGWRYSRSVRP